MLCWTACFYLAPPLPTLSCHVKRQSLATVSCSVLVNEWLSENRIKTCLLACGYHGETIWLVVTDKRVDPTGTPDIFEEFKESERVRQIKSYMDVGDVELVTVADPYGYYY